VRLPTLSTARLEGTIALQKAGLLAVVLIAAGGPASANADQPRHITCEMVRAYVAKVGLWQARAVALAHGMTASQERRARRCLGERGLAADETD
jgi:hypothetical protein